MADSKPHIVLVHGGWHKPISYAKLTASLERAGLTVHIPPLPTMSGQRPPVADLYTDSDFIRSYVTKLSDAGTHSIVVMHSYGGQVGTNALLGLGAPKRASEGKPGGVLELVYLAGFAMVEGTSMTEWVHSQGHKELLPLAFNFEDEGFVGSRDPKKLLVGEELLSEQEMERYIGTFTSWATKSWDDELRNCAWRQIPVTYVETTKDMTALHDYQTKFIEGMRAAGTRVNSVVLETGHCPNITATEEVADVLKKLVKEASA